MKKQLPDFISNTIQTFRKLLIMQKSVLTFILLVHIFWVSAQCNFKSIGHRGGSSYYYPENTLVSLEHGFTEGIYAAEVDVRFTGDSIMVLMHDSYIDRTTNGAGDVDKLTLSYLKSLDAGSWKGLEFAGAKVPTFKEALELADKYGKKLYLNMKVFAPELIAKTIKEAGVDEDIILLDPDDLDKVKKYHEILPKTPLVYFGELPDDINDAEFYGFLKRNGVIAIEIPADYIYNTESGRYEELRDIAHSYQLELWAYTVNDPACFAFLKDFGIDGLETDRPSEASQVFCNNSYGGYFPEKQITGQWDFNFGLQGTIGSQLVLMGDTTGNSQVVKFGTTDSFGLPPIGNTSVNVALIPAFDPQHALRFFSNIAPEGLPGGLDCDNTYTLIFDLLKPTGGNLYTSILQTSNNNSDDADFFLLGESNSFGILENYNGSFEDSTWVRLALVFDLYKERLDEYLDGEHVGTIVLKDSKNGRFCLNNNWGVQSSNFFSDNDNETNPVFVSSIQLRNYAMNTSEIKELGKADLAKIDIVIISDPSEGCPEFENNITDSINGNVVSLFAFAGDTVNYRWEIDKGWGWENVYGVNFSNTASPKLMINYSDDLAGSKFRCIASNDCQAVSNEYNLKDINTGTKLIWGSEGFFTVYPNPSNGKVIIDFANSEKQITVRVYTMLGAEILQNSNITNKFEMNLPPGTYLIHIQSNSISKTRKLIIIE